MSGEPANAEEFEWERAPAQVQAVLDEVHVWRASCSLTAAEILSLRRLLSVDELERAGRFHFARDRDHYTVARAVLRVILGRYLGLPPASVRFKYNSFGKPLLDGDAGDVDVRFNLSHSGGIALYAVALGREVGVDVEQLKDEMDCDGVAEHFFSPGEVAALRALPPEAQKRAFFDCWTRKEAYIKAHGAGLSLPLDSFDVSVAPDEPAALLRTRDDAGEASRWTLRELSPGPGYAAALAAEGRDWRLRCWRWDLEAC